MVPWYSAGLINAAHIAKRDGVVIHSIAFFTSGGGLPQIAEVSISCRLSCWSYAAMFWTTDLPETYTCDVVLNSLYSFWHIASCPVYAKGRLTPLSAWRAGCDGSDQSLTDYHVMR